MTLKEVSVRLGKSESTIKANFKRTQANLLKKGILLERTGRGAAASYSISYIEKISNSDNDWLSLED